jgi:hypothetical protein
MTHPAPIIAGPTRRGFLKHSAGIATGTTLLTGAAATLLTPKRARGQGFVDATVTLSDTTNPNYSPNLNPQRRR